MNRIFAFIFTAMAAVSCGISVPSDVDQVDVCPLVFPDYDSVTIPFGIAPINFEVIGASYVHVRAEGEVSGVVETCGEYADFDISQWHSLTSANMGKSIRVTVTALDTSGRWTRYSPLHIFVSRDSLQDYGLTYRRISPGYETFSNTGIYQRDIHSFDEYSIVEQTAIGGQCMNCHVQNHCDPQSFQLHVRGSHPGTWIQHQGHSRLLDTKYEGGLGFCMYPYWHPSGRYIVYGNGNTYQRFCEGHSKLLEVFDEESEVMVLDVETGGLVPQPVLSSSGLPQFPAFSPDGRTIYLAMAPRITDSTDWNKIYYDLCSISFDSASARVSGKLDTLFRASEQGLSVAMPKPSYDGRFVVFPVCDNSVFPIHLATSDLCLLDLRSGECRKINELNSPQAESYCNWSSNSRWLVFTSRRINGLVSFLYIAHIDEDGNVGKPFLLPQRNPGLFYRSQIYSFNVQDFTRQKVSLDVRALSRQLLGSHAERVVLRR